MHAFIRCLMVMLVVGARVAWPCSMPCQPLETFVLLDGGIPSNLGPVITNLWSAAAYPTGGVEVREVGGAALTSTLRRVDPHTLAIEAAFVEGRTYVVRRAPGCMDSVDAGTTETTFEMRAPIDMPTHGVSVHVADAGFGPVEQYGGPACSDSFDSAFVSLRFDVEPSFVPLFPFYAWTLSLVPLDGGAAVPWRIESVGRLTSSFQLREEEYQGPPMSRVSRICSAGGGGAPEGDFRAELAARPMGAGTAFTSLSEPFHLECPSTPNGCSVGAGSALWCVALLWSRRRRATHRRLPLPHRE